MTSASPGRSLPKQNERRARDPAGLAKTRADTHSDPRRTSAELFAPTPTNQGRKAACPNPSLPRPRRWGNSPSCPSGGRGTGCKHSEPGRSVLNARSSESGAARAHQPAGAAFGSQHFIKSMPPPASAELVASLPPLGSGVFPAKPGDGGARSEPTAPRRHRGDGAGRPRVPRR